jgi:hypothetical protein
MTYIQVSTFFLCLDLSLKLVNVIYLSLIYGNLSNYLFYKEKIMEEIHVQETQLEHDPIIKEEVTWEQAVTKIETIINDLCEEYDKDGHPYYSETLRNHWRRILKG